MKEFYAAIWFKNRVGNRFYIAPERFSFFDHDEFIFAYGDTIWSALIRGYNAQDRASPYLFQTQESIKENSINFWRSWDEAERYPKETHDYDVFLYKRFVFKDAGHEDKPDFVEYMKAYVYFEVDYLSGFGLMKCAEPLSVWSKAQINFWYGNDYAEYHIYPSYEDWAIDETGNLCEEDKWTPSE